MSQPLAIEPRHRQAAEALAIGKTQAEAAKVAGVTPRTIRHWLDREEFYNLFREILEEYHMQIRHQASRELTRRLDNPEYERTQDLIKLAGLEQPKTKVDVKTIINIDSLVEKAKTIVGGTD